MRKAFSMIELVFVITILGIVSSIGASIIAKTYETYIIQKATYNASVKTELAALQIAQRLSYSIPWTVITRNSAAPADYEVLSQLTTPGKKYTILEWIGIDNDSFSATTPPGWSGYCDINASSAISGTTQGSDLAKTDAVIKNLSKNDATITNSAIFFKVGFFANGIPYAADCTGLTSPDNSCAIPIRQNGNTGFIFQNANAKRVAEQYVLSWSAYALVPVAKGNLDGVPIFDLDLYYNYRPWANPRETYLSRNQKSTILNNVTVFKFTAFANTIRFKICVAQSIGEGKPITICKEKAVVR